MWLSVCRFTFPRHHNSQCTRDRGHSTCHSTWSGVDSSSYSVRDCFWCSCCCCCWCHKLNILLALCLFWLFCFWHFRTQSTKAGSGLVYYEYHEKSSVGRYEWLVVMNGCCMDANKKSFEEKFCMVVGTFSWFIEAVFNLFYLLYTIVIWFLKNTNFILIWSFELNYLMF